MPVISYEEAVGGTQPKKIISYEEAAGTVGAVADTLHDATTGVGQGLTLGFKDELFAGVAAPFRAGARAIAGGDEGKDISQRLSDAYTAELEAQRAIQREAETRSPIATGVGEIAGGVMLPIPGGRGATVARTMGRGAAAGAAYGAGYGVGTGEGGAERLSQGATGALIGGGLGGVLPGAAAGVVEAARPLGRMARAAIAPGAEAERRVAQSIATDQAAARTALAPQDMALAQQVTRQPVTNLERGGETTRALARSAANQSPQARDTLNRTVDDRVAGQGDRITQFTRGLVGGTDAGATREALTEAARRANRPAYARAYREGDRPIWTPELARLSTSPDVLAAMNAANKTGRSRAVSEGYGNLNSGVRMGANDTITLQSLRGGGKSPYPNLQFWDYVKRELDDAANAARRAGRNEEASRIGGQVNALRAELDNAVPAYANARTGASTYFGAQDALEAGQNFINRRVDWREAQRAVSRMSAPERQLFAEGFTDSLIRVVERAGDRRNVVNQIYGSQDARTRIRIALGPQRARELEAFLRIESAMDLVRGAVQGNSTTTRQLVELGLVGGGATGYSLASGDPQQAIMGLLYAGGRGMQIRANRGVSNRVAQMLTSDDPTVYLQGVRLVANSPRLMQRLRQVGAIGGVAGAQAGAGLGSQQNDETE